MEVMSATARGVFKSVDINKAHTSSKEDEKCSTIIPKKTPIVEVEQQVLTKEEIKSEFDLICLQRVGELMEGDEDEGLIEWSMNDFEYVRNLGTGGAATVFLAKEKQSGHKVALKIQPEDEDGVCEIDIHQPLDHPCIVELIDYFFSEETFGPEAVGPKKQDEDGEKGSRNMVMIIELCDRGSLFDVIRDESNGYLEEKQAASYFWDALDAIGYLHEQDIIHCDIKSLNFLVATDVCKLADFGMSVRYCEREIVGGSPIYMSPEHLMAYRHLTQDFDHRVDIYSLGVVLYEMLVGYSPYKVIGDDTDGNPDEDSFLDGFDNLFIDDNDVEDDTIFKPPVLDLRNLDDPTSEEPFYMPPPIFPDFVSEEAQDFIMRLMEPNLEERATIDEAKKHSWFQKHNLVETSS